MALGSCYSCIKYLMFAFNFVFWVLGCAILGVGIWLRVDEGAMEMMGHSSKMDALYTLAYVMMAVGFVVMMVGFLGCCGAIRESQCMLGGFFVALFVIFAILLGLGIWAVVAKGSFEDVIEGWLDKGVEKYGKEDTETHFMDTVQEQFECCGSTQGEVDYGTPERIPQTCKPTNYRKFECCGSGSGQSDYIKNGDPVPDSCMDYQQPCLDELAAFWEDKFVLVAGVSIGIAVVMILGMIFAIVLCCAIRDTLA